jgi:hypothetical protein
MATVRYSCQAAVNWLWIVRNSPLAAPFHVAFMSRGPAGPSCNPLVLLGIGLQHARHEKVGCEPREIKIVVYYQLISLVV